MLKPQPQPHGRMTDPQRGAGLIGTSAGFLVFMLMMLAAVQILFNLYATSMVTAAAHDAAREVASVDAADDSGNRCGAVAAAEATFTRSLGEYGSAGHVTLQWTCDNPNVVRVRVLAEHPTVLPTRFAALASLASLDRTIEIRTETRR